MATLRSGYHQGTITSGKLDGAPVLANNDFDNGEAVWTIRVKTRAADEIEDTATDSWGGHDRWTMDLQNPTSFRWNPNRTDKTGTSRYIAGVGATVIIKQKRGAVKGKVTDKATGLPVFAHLFVVDVDPESPDDFPEAYVDSDAITGEYELRVLYASWNVIACEAQGYAPVEARVDVPRNDEIVFDWVLSSAP